MRTRLALLITLLVSATAIPASGSDVAYQLVRVSVDGSQRDVVLVTSSYSVQDLSPNRTQLLDSQGGTLEIRSLDGSNAHTVAAMPNQIDSATWAPETSRIAFTTADLSACSPAATKCATMQVWLVGNDARGPHKIGDNTIYPAWSRDGRRLAFVANYITSAQTGTLAVADAAGRRVRLLRSKGEIDQVDWAPHGGRLAYLTSYPGTALITATKSTSRPATVARANDLSWSPDGWQIAVTDVEPNRRSHPRADLIVVDLRTRHARTIASAPSIPQVAWSPNGRWIAYTRGGLFGNEVVLVTPNGRTTRVIATEVGDRAEITRVFWPPDSRSLLYAVHGNS